MKGRDRVRAEGALRAHCLVRIATSRVERGVPAGVHDQRCTGGIAVEGVVGDVERAAEPTHQVHADLIGTTLAYRDVAHDDLVVLDEELAIGIAPHDDAGAHFSIQLFLM